MNSLWAKTLRKKTLCLILFLVSLHINAFLTWAILHDVGTCCCCICALHPPSLSHSATHFACPRNAHRQENQHYTVLLIITDGVINDFDNTKVGRRGSSQMHPYILHKCALSTRTRVMNYVSAFVAIRCPVCAVFLS
jgi:hypothetical protein